MCFFFSFFNDSFRRRLSRLHTCYCTQYSRTCLHSASPHVSSRAAQRYHFHGSNMQMLIQVSQSLRVSSGARRHSMSLQTLVSAFLHLSFPQKGHQRIPDVHVYVRVKFTLPSSVLLSLEGRFGFLIEARFNDDAATSTTQQLCRGLLVNVLLGYSYRQSTATSELSSVDRQCFASIKSCVNCTPAHGPVKSPAQLPRHIGRRLRYFACAGGGGGT